MALAKISRNVGDIWLRARVAQFALRRWAHNAWRHRDLDPSRLRAQSVSLCRARRFQPISVGLADAVADRSCDRSLSSCCWSWRDRQSQRTDGDLHRLQYRLLRLDVAKLLRDDSTRPRGSGLAGGRG